MQKVSAPNLKLLRDQLRDALLEWIGHLSNGFYIDQFDERIDTRQFSCSGNERVGGKEGRNL